MMNLGDLSHDIFWYEFDFDVDDAYKVVAEQKLPLKMYSVPGNHDNDGAIVGDNVDFRSGWLYRRLGPGPLFGQYRKRPLGVLGQYNLCQ